jgi:hypothetical protein
MAYIQEVLGSIRGYPDQGFHGFPMSLLANSETVLGLGHGRVVPNLFPVL